MLKDVERANKIQSMFEHWVFKETRKETVKALLAPRPINCNHQLLGRFQNMLEQSLFNFAQRLDPEYPSRMGWQVAEQVEIQNWNFTWKRLCADKRLDFYPKPDLLYKTIGDLRYMRNIAAHRSIASDYFVMSYLKESMMLATLVDDRFQALEIEILGEQWLTSSSRSDVLFRLQNVFLNVDDDEVNKAPWEIVPAIPPGSDSAEELLVFCLTVEAEDEYKCVVERARKRRYAVAKVLLSSIFKGAKPRSRCFPRALPSDSFLLNVELLKTNKAWKNLAWPRTTRKQQGREMERATSSWSTRRK